MSRSSRSRTTLAHARQVVSSTKFRAACVVDSDGKLAGVLTRTTLLDDVRRSVILLDHNEASQAVDGIEEADIVEIIDHHRLAAITTLKTDTVLQRPGRGDVDPYRHGSSWSPA